MPTWKTVRVFISSTFSDMHAERDCLAKVGINSLSPASGDCIQRMYIQEQTDELSPEPGHRFSCSARRDGLHSWGAGALKTRCQGRGKLTALRITESE